MSEEDIKILEELLEEGFEAMCPLEAQALENLIKAYKELEEENRIFALEGCRVRLKMYIDNNYIPVSLVEEKIEKLKEYKLSLLQENYVKKQKEFTNQNVLVCNAIRDIAATGKLEILQELLKDGGK